MINELTINHIYEGLKKVMIDDLDIDDPTRAGAVIIGYLQGNPDTDEARISITIHENDPDNLVGGGLGQSIPDWEDRVEEIEIGGGITWKRRYTIKARCLLEATRENLGNARHIASVIKSRIERTLITMKFNNIDDGRESVVKGMFSENLHSYMVQAGGPPDAYDFHIKVRVELLTYEMLGD